jgi:hypothetical protein
MKRMHSKIANVIFINKLLQKFCGRFCKSIEIINENLCAKKQNTTMSDEKPIYGANTEVSSRKWSL